MSRKSIVSGPIAFFESLESRSLLSATTSSLALAASSHAAPSAAVRAAAQNQSGTGLSGEYFIGDNFQQPLLVRVDPRINFASGYRPDPSLASGAFSVRWTGQIQARFSQTYTFTTKTTDGVRLWVNGQLLIDNWAVQSKKLNSATIDLAAGQKVDIRMDYFFSGTGDPLAQLAWASRGEKKRIVQKSALYPDTTVVLPPSSGLVGTYFRGANFQHEVFTRNDQAIDFNFHAGTPNPSIPHHPFSIRLTGQITAQFSETYTISTRADDGVRVIINGQTVVDDYSVHGPRSSQGTIDLQAGVPNDITLEYFENEIPPGVLQVSWSSPSTPLAVIPASAFTENLSGLGQPNLTGSPVSDTQVHLSWNDVTGETGFTIETSLDNVNFTKVATVGTGTTTLDIGGLTPNTSYYYRVIATNDAGPSAPSNVAQVTTFDVIPSFASLTTLYGLTTSIFSIDTATGAATQIHPVLFNTYAGGRDPVTGDFYYISTDPSSVQIAKWDPAAPSASADTVVNNAVPVTGVVRRAAFRSDGLFFFTANTGDLYSYDVNSNVSTALGTIKAGGVDVQGNNGDMAFGPDGNLYVECESIMYDLTPADIAAANGSIVPATLIGPTNSPNLQVSFGQNGVLFGYDQSGQIYTVDLNTGNATVIPGTSPSTLTAIGDLASVPLYADLAVNQTASTLTAGLNGTYTVTVANNGPNATIRPILVTDVLPTGLTFVSAAGNGWTFNLSGQTLTMIYGSDVPAGTALPSVTLTVAVSGSATGSVINPLSVGTSIFDTDLSNNSNSLTTSIAG